MFELRGGGQHVVGEVGRVGHEMFEHDGEQVLARKALGHFVRLRRDGDRVAVVDHEGFDLGAEVGVTGVQQRVADRAHVDGARAAVAEQIRALQRRTLEWINAGRGQQQPARAVLPGADKCGQAGNRADGVAAAACALHAVVHADGGLRRGAVVAGELLDLLDGQAADLGRALGRPLQRAFFQRIPTERVARDVVVVQPVVGDEFMHQCQRERRVGAGQQLQMFVAFVGGFALARIDANEPRAVAFGLLRKAPEMQVAADAVAAPDEDQFAFGIELHAHAELAAVGVRERFAACGGADRAVQKRCAELVKKAPVHALALHHAHGARVAVGQHGFGVALGDAVQAGGDVGERFIPRHRHELPAALGAHALERLQHAFGVIRAFGVLADLGAEHAAGELVVGVAIHLGGDAVDHCGDERTGVRAVVGTCALHGA